MGPVYRLGIWVALLASALLAGGAQGAVINYANCSDGGTVMYVDISESSNQAPLYGAPDCTGNQIDWDPQDFQVARGDPDPEGFSSLDGQLNFTIMATSGNVVDEISIGESGDFQVLGFDPSNTFASVTLTTRLEIIIPGPLGTEFTVEFEDQQSDAFVIPDDFSFNAQTWSLEADFVISDILDAACNGTGPFESPVTEACDAQSGKVKVVIDNTLAAFAESGERAFINKKDVDGLTVTANMDNPVPEPGTAALLGLGLLGLALRSRSRRP